MPKDRGVGSTRIHKTNLRRFVKDERISSRLRLAAELLLARIEGTFPTELIDMILASEFGAPNRFKKDETVEISDVVEKEATKGLTNQWKDLVRRNDTGTENTTA